MKYLLPILFAMLLPDASAETPPVRLPTDTTVEGETVVLQNLPGGDNRGENFIVGGTLAARNEFQSFVLGNGCGGTLIHTDIVLTAAHCKGAFKNRVLVGAVVSGSTKKGAEWRNVLSNMQVHPQYNAFKSVYDYMIFKIEPSNKTPSKLNTDPTFPVAGQSLRVAGFGVTSENSLTASKKLRKVTVSYIEPSTCDSLLGPRNTTAELCAGEIAGGKDTCQGDSGSGIFSLDGVQVGVVSWGIGCARKNKPGVYARISGALDWINEQTCALSSSPPAWCSDGSRIPAPTPSIPAPTPAPIPMVSVTVTVQYDAFPEEFGWSIVDTTTRKTVVNYPASTFYAANKFLSGTIQLVQGRTYKLTMKDTAGDGICCKDGNGYLEVKNNADNQYLVSIWGATGSSYSVKFTA